MRQAPCSSLPPTIPALHNAILPCLLMMPWAVVRLCDEHGLAGGVMSSPPLSPQRESSLMYGMQDAEGRLSLVNTPEYFVRELFDEPTVDDDAAVVRMAPGETCHCQSQL